MPGQGQPLFAITFEMITMCSFTCQSSSPRPNTRKATSAQPGTIDRAAGDRKKPNAMAISATTYPVLKTRCSHSSVPWNWNT